MSDQKKFRITLWQLDTNSGWRSSSAKAVVYDAMSIGVQENANDVGSAYWTLNNDHPQISKFTPLDTHYEIARWSLARSRWEFVAAGILDDYSVTEYQTTFSGLDYMAVMNQIFTPLSNITFSSSTPLNPNIATMTIPTVFNQTDGTIAKDNINGAVYDTTGNAYYDYTNTAVMNVNSVSVEAFAQTTKTIVADGRTASAVTPYIKITYSAAWVTNSPTANFLATPQWRFRINASPPGQADSGNAPIGEYGKVAEFSTPADGSGTSSKFTVTNRVVELFPYETKQELRTALLALGADDGDVDTAMPNAVSVTGTSASKYTTGPLTGWSLRKGLTYAFQIYGAIHRTDSGASTPSTGLPIWYGTLGGQKTLEVTLGQGTENIAVVANRVFNNAKTINLSRIRYATLSISGSTQTTHTTYSAGQPVVGYIGDIADMEMGAKTDGSKVVFGIDRPTGTATYSGNFKLQMSVSSAASTAFALRYPENIKAFSFTPGFSKVRNDITIIPTERYLSGATAQGSEGAQIIGATASDSASLNLYGRLPLVAAQGGFVNATAAQNQATRLLNSYKPANAKQVGLAVVVDGVDLWYGWDVGDSVRVTIKRGLVDVDEPFVIAGIRWFGESAGHERVELDLIQGSAFAAAFTAPPSS